MEKDIKTKLAELSAQFPEDKYIWIMPQLTLAGSLPEHLDFVVSERGFSSDPDDKDVYFIEHPKDIREKNTQTQKWETVGKTEAFVALTGRAVFALASDAGVKFLPQLNRRIDGGLSPNTLIWTATGMLTGLSGMTPVTKTKHIDLTLEQEKWEFKARNKPPAKIYPPPSLHDYGDPKDWKTYNAALKEGVWTNAATPAEFEWYIKYTVKKNELQFKTFMLEIGETKAQLRVIRSLIAIASSYKQSTIAEKKFAVLRVILNPQAQSPDERKLILSGMMNNYLSAFPGAGLLPEPETRPALTAGAERFIDEPEVEEMPDGWNPSGEKQAPAEDIEPEAENGEPENKSESLEDGPAPQGPQESNAPGTTANFEFLGAVKKLKDELIRLLEQDSGEAIYYETLKTTAEVDKSNKITDPAKQAAFYKALKGKVDEAVEFLNPIDEGESQEPEAKSKDEPADPGPKGSPRIDTEARKGGEVEPEKSKSPATATGVRERPKDPLPPTQNGDPQIDEHPQAWLLRSRKAQLSRLPVSGISKHVDALVKVKGYDMTKDRLGFQKKLTGPGDPKDALIWVAIELMKLAGPVKKGGRN